MESSWFCSASICSFRARTWRSWLVVKSVIFVMAEFVMWGGVGSQTRKWVGLSDWDNGSNRNWRKTRDFCFDRESWTKYVSLTVVIIAVVGSIAAQWSGAAFTGHASRSTQLVSSSAGMRYPTPQGSSFPSPQVRRTLSPCPLLPAGAPQASGTMDPRPFGYEPESRPCDRTTLEATHRYVGLLRIESCPRRNGTTGGPVLFHIPRGKTCVLEAPCSAGSLRARRGP